jgi:hypothetical protein
MPWVMNSAASYDFVEDRTHDGRKYRMLNVLEQPLGERLHRELQRPQAPRPAAWHDGPGLATRTGRRRA